MLTGAPKAVARLATAPVEVELALHALRWGVAIEEEHGALVIVPAGAEDLSRREMLAATGGVVGGLTEQQDGLVEVQLTAGASPTRADHVAAWLRGRGLELLQWVPAERRAVAGAVGPLVATVRDRVAGLLKVAPWQIGIAVTEEGDRIGEVRVTRAPAVSPDPVRRRELWQQLVLALPGGSNGWRVAEDATTGDVTLTYGEPRALPAMVPLADLLPDALAPEGWATLPLGRGEDGAPVGFDLTLGPHCLIVGPTGSGKTVALASLAAQQLARGHDLVILDPTKGVDFAVLAEFTRGFARTYDETVALLDAVYAEGQRRKALLLAHGEVKWSDLAPEVREAEGVRPISVIVDEMNSLFIAPDPPKGLAKDDPRLEEIEELVAQKAAIRLVIGQIARELRFVGVHLVIGLHRPDASILSGELRSNLTSTCQLTKPGSTPAPEAIRMIFPGDLAAEAHLTLRELDDGRSRGFGVVAGDGGGVAGVRIAYAGMHEIPALLAERGIRPSGRPPFVAPAAPASPAPVAQQVPDFDDLFADEEGVA